MRHTIRFGLLVATSAAALAAFAPPHAAAQQPVPPYLKNFPNFAPDLTPPFPGDVDVAMQKQLEGAQQFAEVQRLFDLDAWQMFLAVNWPTNNGGQPDKSITDQDAPHWTLPGWQESAQVYRVDGKRPQACGPPAGALAAALGQPATEPAPLLRGLSVFAKPQTPNPRFALSLANISAVGNISFLDLNKGGEIDQAFAGPLIDQNGHFVHYSIVLDPNETKYVCDTGNGTGVYNINGQVKLSNEGHTTLEFPSGNDKEDWSGATELKFAWKILSEDEKNSKRFFTMTATLPPGEIPGDNKVTVGLVGMHIGHKSESSPQWIWATFEQVDNLVGDPLAHPAIKPSFYNPSCEICLPNLDPKVTKDVKTPTQAMRAVPIPGDKIQLNAEAQAVLRQLGSVWQYYELIDTQWPTNPKAAPAAIDGPDAVTNKSGGDPTPVFLTNITMETYFQTGVQLACNQVEGNNCSPNAVVNTTRSTLPVATSNVQVFASESCMGCHSSAGFYKSYDATKPRRQNNDTWPQLSADFSWLPSQKAYYYEPGK